MAQGYYLDRTTYVIPGDGVYKWMDDRNGGLGKFDWNKIIDLAAPIATGFGGYLAGKSSGRYPDYSQYGQQPGGAYVGVTPYGAAGGMDTTTIMLLAGAGILLVLLMKK